MDRNLSETYKKRIAYILEEHLNNTEIFTFVNVRLVVTILPSIFEPKIARNIAIDQNYIKSKELFISLEEKIKGFEQFYTLLISVMQDDFKLVEKPTAYQLDKLFLEFAEAIFKRSAELYNDAVQKSQEIFADLELPYSNTIFETIQKKLSSVYDVQLGLQEANSINKSYLNDINEIEKSEYFEIDKEGELQYRPKKPGNILSKRELRIRAFRASEDFETCLKFYEGHKKVLIRHGFPANGMADPTWLKSKSVFVIIAEDRDRTKIYGGARIHCFDGASPLPIQQATEDGDPKINDFIDYYSKYGTGELCGLWNSLEVAGLGIGSLFPARAAIAIAKQIGLSTIFSLCSPATVRFNQWLGSRVFTEIGSNGTFYYPKLDLQAIAVFLEDVNDLSNAHPREKQKITFLRENPSVTLTEKSPFKDIPFNIYYNLNLLSANNREFKIDFLRSKIDFK
jgi:hypothetical protein